jgi:chromosomal replication initiation ATPase DnaA
VTLDQLAFDLPHRAALGAEDFLVSDCNVPAVKLIDAWPDWQAPVQLLTGPPASGKTHLVRV